MARRATHCVDCRVPLTRANRGRWGPDYWCQACDERRVERVSRQFREIAAGFGPARPAAAAANPASITRTEAPE